MGWRGARTQELDGQESRYEGEQRDREKKKERRDEENERIKMQLRNDVSCGQSCCWRQGWLILVNFVDVWHPTRRMVLSVCVYLVKCG